VSETGGFSAPRVTSRPSVAEPSPAADAEGAFPALPRTWARFAAESPELAAAGERLLRTFTVGYLATVRDDGAPRVHPVSVTLHGEGLYVFVIAGTPKLRDLLENGHFALHAFPTLPADDAWDDEEFMIGGRARRVLDAAERAAVASVHPDDVAPDDVLFELRAERAVHKQRDRGDAVYRVWTSH
jgi:hypothetical protein